MKYLVICLSISVLANPSYAGGFDNSNFNFDAIYNANNILTIEYGHSTVPMQATIKKGNGDIVKSGKIIEDRQYPVISLSYHLNKQVPCAAKYEQPYSADIAYKDDSLAYVGVNPETNTETTFTAPVATKYESESLALACGYRLNLNNSNILVFAGPKLQSIKGSFSEDLGADDTISGNDDNLSVSLDGGSELGYIAGFAYSIPDYAIRASLLYHSQINYDLTGSNSARLPDALGGAAFKTRLKTKTITPQTIELALQSGIAESTYVALRLRWSEYSKLDTLVTEADYSVEVGGFTLAQINAQATAQTNSQRTANGLTPINSALSSLVEPELEMFSNDTLDYSFSLGHKLSNKTAVGVSFSAEIKLGSKDSDVPLGADSSSLRLPGDTAHTLSVGMDHQLLDSMNIFGGLAYTFIDEYRVETTPASGSFRAEFDKTHSTSILVGLSYKL